MSEALYQINQACGCIVTHCTHMYGAHQLWKRYVDILSKNRNITLKNTSKSPVFKVSEK